MTVGALWIASSNSVASCPARFRSHRYDVFLTIDNNQARAFPHSNPSKYRNALRHASCTMSSASAALRVSQRARL